MLTLGVLGVLLLAAATTTGTTLMPFTFEVSAADPMLVFTPIGPRTRDIRGANMSDNAPSGANSVPPTEGWEMTYSGVSLPLANITSETPPAGTPKRTSAFPGARVGMEFIGTGVVFWGNCSRMTAWVGSSRYDAVCSNGMLVNVTNLPYGLHNIELRLDSGSVELYSASILTAMETNEITMDKVKITNVSTTTEKAEISPDFAVNARWLPRWSWQGGVWYHIGTTFPSLLTYSVPANTSFMAVYGATTSYSGDYRVSFTPPAWNKPLASNLSLFSNWSVPDVVLWAGPLDPATKYEMKLETLLRNRWYHVSQVRMWSAGDVKTAAPDTPPSSAPDSPTNIPADNTPSSKTGKAGSSTIGAIVGGVVGGVAALVAISLLIFCLRRRKSPKPEPLDILDDDMYEYQPQSVIGHNRGQSLVGEGDALLSPVPTEPERATSPSLSLIENGSSSARTGRTGAGDGTAPPIASTKNGFAPLTEVTVQEMDADDVVNNVVPPSYEWASGSGNRP